jgi:hypothetical protein
MQFLHKKEHPWFLRPFDFLLSHPIYFSAARRPVCGALWIGLFVGCLPMPGQTILAVFAALLFRVNIPVAAITIWISNPLTFGPIFYLGYRIGAIVLNIPPEAFPAEFEMDWVLEQAALRWKPLLLGSVLLGMSLASVTYLVVSAVWHQLTIQRYRRRHQRSIGNIRGGKS